MRDERHKHPVSLIIMDIDNFKKYNDTHGHPQGDEVLRRLCKILKKTVRRTDIVARYGGEEFVIILPETDRDNALIVAEKLRQEIEKTPFPNEETQPNGKITVSVGVATYPVDANSKTNLIDVTDNALYEAKDGGRNRVVQAKPQKLLRIVN